MTLVNKALDDIFKPKCKKTDGSVTSMTLDERLSSSAKKLLLHKIEFVEAKKSYSLNIDQLKSKYVLLNPCKKNGKERILNGVKASSSFVGCLNDGIPTPKCEFFAPEKIELTWKNSMRVGGGLFNLGNTCFLNSALQCLSYTPPLANYLINANHKGHCRMNGQFCMLCSLQQHVRTIFTSNGHAIKPWNMVKNLKLIAKHMMFGKQEDAHEFIRYSIEAMQKSCLFGYSSKLDIHTKATTFVYRVFGGYLRSRIRCNNCKAVSDTYDPILDISLDINKKGCSDLRGCLKLFVTPEILQGDNLYKCDRCKKAVCASKTFSFHRLPNVLTIQLKRFSSFMGNKINGEVSYPSMLNLDPYMSSPTEGGSWYELYAVLVHSGYSSYSGHYYAYVKVTNGQWYCFNDASVYQVASQEALRQQAYMLFYHRALRRKTSTPVAIKTSKFVQKQREPILITLNKEITNKDKRFLNVQRVHVNGGISTKNNLTTDIKTKSKQSTFISTFKSSSNSLISNEVNSGTSSSHLTKLQSHHTGEMSHSFTKETNSYRCLPSSNGTGNASNSHAAHSSIKPLKQDSTEAKHISPTVRQDLLQGTKNLTKPATPYSKIKERNDKDVVNSQTQKDPNNSKVAKSASTENESQGCVLLERQTRKRSISSDSSSSSRKVSKTSSHIPRVSFQLKSFTKLPHHQQHWQKLHNPKLKVGKSKIVSNTVVNGKHKDNGDNQSLSSNDSRRSDRERENHKLKLKMLKKRSLSDKPDASNELRKRPRLSSLSSNSDTSASSDSSSQPAPLQSVVVQKWDAKGNSAISTSAIGANNKERHGILSKLLQQSSSKAYGSRVPSWNGEQSYVEKEAADDYKKRHTSAIDGWDREYDRGRTKKVKSKQSQKYNNNSNLFQKFQNYHHTPTFSSY